jgi:hypothetical protein
MSDVCMHLLVQAPLRSRTYVGSCRIHHSDTVASATMLQFFEAGVLNISCLQVAFAITVSAGAAAVCC